MKFTLSWLKSHLDTEAPAAEIADKLVMLGHDVEGVEDRSAGLAGFISVRNEYSLLDRSIEAEVVPACERFGLGVLPYFPLAQGLLTGKFRRGEPAAPGTRLATRPEVLDSADWDVVEALAAFAEERDVGLLDVAIGWLAAQPAVASVIAGATRPEQVRANVAAAEWSPSVEDLAALDAITAPQR